MSKCPGCGASVDMPPGVSVGAQHRQTGFIPLFTHTGSILWVCPTCHGKVHQLAIGIAAILGEGARHIYFPSLLKERRDAS